MADFRNGVLLGLILAFGLALRLYGLEAKSLWLDELAIAIDTSGAFADMWAAFTEGHQRHPPLYGVLMWVWVQCFGDGEVSLRLPSVIAGTLTIPAVFLLGRKLYGAPEGLVAALLVAVAQTSLRFSQEVRPYGLLMLLGTLTSWLLLEFLHREAGSRRRLFALAYLAAAVALAYLHYFGAITIFAQGVVAAIWTGRRRQRWLEVAALFGAVALAFLPWLHVVLAHIERGSHLKPVEPRNLGNYALMILGGGTATGLVFAVGLALVSLRRRTLPALRGGTATLLILALMPLLLAIVVSWVVTPIFNDRNFVATLPAVALILARMLLSSLQLRRSAAVCAVAFAVVTLLDTIVLWRYYWVPKVQYREVAAATIARYGEPEKTILVLCADPGRLEYYFRQFGATPRVDALACRPEELKGLDWKKAPLAGATSLLLPLARHSFKAKRVARFRQLVSALGQRFSVLECDGFRRAALYRFSGPGAATGEPPVCKPPASAVGEAPFVVWWETVRPDFFR